MGVPTISYSWRTPKAHGAFRAGVSLHSHTNHSRESLAFLAKVATQNVYARPIVERIDRWVESNFGAKANYEAAYWTPPLPPRLAYELERDQIAELGLAPMVSITDHDTITAPLLLRSVLGAPETPISVEWSVPYGEQSFHIGVHNLPAATAAEWMKEFAALTAAPDTGRIVELLAELKRLPEVLLVFNHPMWDLYLIGRERHRFLVGEFLGLVSERLHAVELNALRNWEENRAARRLAEQWGLGLVSGGDRHGMEPNAAINLTNAATFAEFVAEVREGHSEILFLPQYAEPWEFRMVQSTIDAVRNYPEFPQGHRNWDERFFHPDAHGVDRPLSQLWVNGRPPLALSGLLRLSRLVRRRLVSAPLRLVWSDSQQLRMAMGERDG